MQPRLGVQNKGAGVSLPGLDPDPPYVSHVTLASYSTLQQLICDETHQSFGLSCLLKELQVKLRNFAPLNISSC